MHSYIPFWHAPLMVTSVPKLNHISNAPCHFVRSTTLHMLGVRHMTHMHIPSIIITFRAYFWVICIQIVWSLYTICCIQSFFLYLRTQMIVLRTWRKLLTISGVSKLSAGYTGIHSSPSIITHCTPSSIQTNFHTTFIWLSTSNQPDTSISASYCVLKCIELFHQCLL